MVLESIKSKLIQSNLDKYGVNYPSMTESIKEKIKQTNLEKYGVDHSSKNDDVKKKKTQTYMERYGVKNPMQNSTIAEKALKNRFKLKEFEFPSGKIIKVQGYEHFCLKYLLINGILENDIITGMKNVPEIWWHDKEGNKHRYYTDCYIVSQNKCIEVKSKYIHLNKKKMKFC